MATIMNSGQIDNEVLNDLIKINNDRIEGYQKAADELSPEDDDLRVIFAELSRQSEANTVQLVHEVQRLGEEPERGTTTAGKVYRAWMDVKALFTGHDRKTILANCETGEDAAKIAYHSALNTEGISENVRQILHKQQTALLTAHNHIKSLRDSVL